MAQAQENVERLKDAVGVQVERSYNKVERTKKMLEVAAQVVKLRSESERVAREPIDATAPSLFRSPAGVGGHL